MPFEPIPITFSGGMNNMNTPLELFSKRAGETVLLVNADTTLGGRLKLLRPLIALNETAENSSIHTIFRANNVVLVGTGPFLKYLASDGVSLTTLLSSLTAGHFSISHAGNWVFMGNGSNNKSVYLPGPTGCDWGQAIPSYAPTVATGAAGNPNDTYSCYYRYKITLPDGSIIRTGLSPVATVAPSSEKIEWSDLIHADFAGASENAIELFRMATGWAATYLVDTVVSPTTTYSDNESDATVKANTEFAETDYYPPPSGVNVALYHPGADRMFCAVNNAVYWSEAGKYHIFTYNSASDLYANVNAVFLAGENVTSLIIFDEQLYIGSNQTWRRLRGKNPDYWSWEDISGAIKGPINHESVALTAWGAVYPGNDGYMWIFNGFEARRILEHFIFDTKPTSSCNASFDGRFYRLFYGDSNYPELVLDFLGFPSILRVVQSTRSATASHYDKESSEFYMGDSSGYLRNGEDTDTEVTMSVMFPEIPIEKLIDLGNAGSLLVHVKTAGDNLIVTPYQDDVAQDALTAFTSSSLTRQALPLPLNEYRALSFLIRITSNGDVELREPWIIREEDDG